MVLPPTAQLDVGTRWLNFLTGLLLVVLPRRPESGCPPLSAGGIQRRHFRGRSFVVIPRSPEVTNTGLSQISLAAAVPRTAGAGGEFAAQGAALAGC